MCSTSATHKWCITWDYCPYYLVNNCGSYLKEETVNVLHIGGGILLSQQLWLMKKEENMQVGEGIRDCNSYVLHVGYFNKWFSP